MAEEPELSNVGTVQEIYAAFGRGDIPFILEQLSETVEWDRGSKSDVPWMLPRQGKAGVGAFFEALSGFEITKFVPYKFLDGGDVVAALIEVEATVTKTGISVSEEDETHVWTFDAQGKVARFSHKVDSHAQWKAYHGA